MITTLALLTAGLSPATITAASPDVVANVIRQAQSDWDGIQTVSLGDNPYRDKRRLCADLDALMKGAKADLHQDAATALLEGLDGAAPAGLVWRTHELRSRLLGSDPGEAHAALTAALEAYPAEEYPAPMKHSYFQHLVNARATYALDALGGKAAAKEILELLRSDSRFTYFYADPLQSTFLAKGDPENLQVLFSGAAKILKERDPGAARDLRSRSIPQVLRLGGDPKKLYVLIGGDRPGAKKLPLVVIMPGGGGQALEFLPWMQHLTEPLLGKYQFAVLSAPVWQEGQGEHVVWTTERHKRKYKAKFTVEEFARDVAKEHSTAKTGAYLFAWSSGGPAAYATILDRDKTFVGAYVLASVFWPEQLNLRHAKGKRFVLEQAYGDDITKFHFAEEANDVLTKRGADVKFVPFKGGHGFTMPDAKASFAQALQFLTVRKGKAKREAKSSPRRE